MEESVVFIFLYKTNRNYATKKYFLVPWNCKQIRDGARNSMSNQEIYFSLFSKTMHTILSIFTALSQNIKAAITVTFGQSFLGRLSQNL